MKHGERLAYHIVLAFLSLTIFLFIILFIFILLKNKKKPKLNETVYDQNSDQESPSVKLCASPYTLVDIDVATDGFNERRIIGKGRLGTVYAAVLARGELVAIKRIHPRFVLRSSGLGVGLGFSSILKWLSLANHPNVLSILGFSEGPGERIVVMEFMGMMSLDFYLHQSDDNASLLDWGKRLRVAAGVARGLEYLHELMAPCVVHGCVKPSNILIDIKFSAKICDYGLYFLASNEKDGIFGYVDKEYWVEPKGASKESDVYGLGVVLLELLSGRRSEGGLIVKWSLPLIKEMKMEEILDPRLVVPNDIKPLVRLAKVASACVGNSRKNRPLIGQVVAILNDLQDEVMLGSNRSL
ncbi:serine/threonine-protein kinase-like protein ACR4 [Rutidosis leptorrhynchoides]|uniref:serine/threonine-protein kinase-like protein ACR4 n=1 Tax=Rutidosis leptorrhynchoides TaxID=125765 RepID=UPI003A98D35C